MSTAVTPTKPMGELSVDEKRDLLKMLLSLRGGDPLAPFPLAIGQQSLWYVNRLAPESPAYNFLYAAKIEGDVDAAVLRSALNALATRHPALRSRFYVQDGQPWQKAETTLIPQLVQHDVTGLNDAALLEKLRERADLPFDLATGPAWRVELFRRGQNDQVLLLVYHHIIGDLWSMDILLEELQELYLAQKQSRNPKLVAPKAKYSDYVRWQLTWVHGPKGQAAWEHWRKLLDGAPMVLDLPTDRARPPVQTYRGTSHSWHLAPETVKHVRDLAKKNSGTPFLVMLTAFQTLLAKITGQYDFLIGTATADRTQPEWEHLVGYFLNQIPFRGKFVPEESFQTLLEKTRDQVHLGLEHHAFPFGQMVKRLQPTRDPSRSPLFQVMFIWDKPRSIDLAWEADQTGGTARRADAFLKTITLEQRGAPFDLTFIVFEIGDRLTCSLRYNSDLFDEATIVRFASMIDALLATLVPHADTPVGLANLLNAAEERKLVVENNATAAPIPNVWLHQQVEEHARATPDAPALLFQERVWTYRDLNAQANRLARRLEQEGVHQGDIVALALPRQPETLIAILALWKLGAAYLFVDPNYPTARQTFLLEDAKPRLLVTWDCQPDVTARTLQLATLLQGLDRFSDSNLNTAIGLEDRAYVIYTSGSTGQPKGTALCHRGLSNLCEAQIDAFGLKASDRCVQFASLSFDASVFEIAMGWRIGAALIVLPAAAALPGPEMVRELEVRGATQATLPPSVLAMLPADRLPALKTLVVAGEASSADLVAEWSNGRRFFNAYGPTEATVWSTVELCKPDGQTPSIGKPIRNTRVYVLDDQLLPLPVGVPGELFLAGAGLALGYLNRPELNAERFLPDPFATEPGSRMYRTGDRVRWKANGTIEFLGRIDFQLKLRGYRVEPEEVQEVLRRHDAVADAAVIPRLDGQKRPILAAFVVARDQDNDFPMADLRSYLRDRLPHYMLPSHVACIDRLPLTVHGKIDRDALVKLPLEIADTGNSAVGARNATEEHLTRIWSQVLKVPRVGIHDNFFDLGGASIQTLEVVEEAKKFGLQLSPELILQFQTIAELAGAATKQDAEEEASPTLKAPMPFAAATCERTLPTTPLAATPIKNVGGGALIESIGTYLPPKVVTTEEVLKGCKAKLDFPLQRLTGISARRMAGEKEFSIDLATQALSRCLAQSTRHPSDFDLLICCNISRYDGPEFKVGLEPSTAHRLKAHFGLTNALALDISNACAGTFTSLRFIDLLLRQSAIKNALVVSGEYISHLTRTAQLEIKDFLDSRLACLTLGDSGVALSVTRAPSEKVGFQDLNLYTLGKYHGLCVAKMTREPHGGAIMYTDPVTSATVTINQAVGHALGTLTKHGWDPGSIAALIMHQTSATTIDGARREINRVTGKETCTAKNTVVDLTYQGNTATNTHFLAISNQIGQRAVKDNDRVLFAVSGSGQTVGTALYIFDDLPTRMLSGKAPQRVEARATESLQVHRLSKPIAIGAVATSEGEPDTVKLTTQAGKTCLARWQESPSDIELVLYSGIYRSDYLSEPAVASIAAGMLGINCDEKRSSDRSTLAFDVAQGATGSLASAWIASQWLQNDGARAALVLASEIEPNEMTWPESLVGAQPMGSSLVLQPSKNQSGFLAFGFRAFPELVESSTAHTCAHNNLPAVDVRRMDGFEAKLLEAIQATVPAFLERAGVKASEVKLVLPMRRSPEFAAQVAKGLNLPTLASDETGDKFTSSLAWSLDLAAQEGKVQPGDLVLVVEAGSGLQVGCALLRW